MEIYAEREGNAQCGHATFEALRGLRIDVRTEDGETLVYIDCISDPIVVVEGLPSTIKVYQLPDS